MGLKYFLELELVLRIERLYKNDFSSVFKIENMIDNLDKISRGGFNFTEVQRVQNFLKYYPNFHFKIFISPFGMTISKVKIQLTRKFEYNRLFHNKYEFFWLVIESDNKILLIEQL